jgi:hypothetical protein
MDIFFSSQGRGFALANFSPHSSGLGNNSYSNHMDQFSPHDNRSGAQSKEGNFQANPNQQHQKPPTRCQICDQYGHAASKCWYRYDYSHDPNNQLSQALVSTTLLDTQDHDLNWYTNTGATSHMTYDKGNLWHSSIYHGNNHVVVGNGTRLKISHIGCRHWRKNSIFFLLFFLDTDPHLACVCVISISFPFRDMSCVCVCGNLCTCVRVCTNLESPPTMGNLRCGWAPISNRFYLV